MLYFGRFKSEIFTPESYVEEAKDLLDARYPADECPPYMVIYDTLHSVCEEQRNIVDGRVDLMVLSSAIGAPPRLTELSLCFCELWKSETGWSHTWP